MTQDYSTSFTKEFGYDALLKMLPYDFSHPDVVDAVSTHLPEVANPEAMASWFIGIAIKLDQVEADGPLLMKTFERTNWSVPQIMTYVYASRNHKRWNHSHCPWPGRRSGTLVPEFPIAVYRDRKGKVLYEGAPIMPDGNKIPRWALKVESASAGSWQLCEHEWRLFEQFEWDEKYAGCEWVEAAPAVVVGEVALYRMFSGAGVLLYVGQSINWPSRMKQHKGDKEWFRSVARVDVEYHEAGDIDAVEREAIVSERPLHNVVHNALALS